MKTNQVCSKSTDKRFRLIDSERRFRRSCEQIILLNTRLGELQLRYNRAKDANHKSFRYSLRLRLSVMEGLRNTYYEYAHAKAEQVGQLRKELFGEIVEIVTEDDDGFESD
jgi:hypothetical protein